MIRKLFLLSLVSLLFSGCAFDVANRYYAEERYPPKPVESVEILYEEPAGQYQVIADFQSKGENAEDIRRKAAQIGADAVIVQRLGGVYGNGEEWAKEEGWTKKYYKRIAGTAINYNHEKGNKK